MSEPAKPKPHFDPQDYVRKNFGKARKDYLDVSWRLLWLRTFHPDASIETDIVEITDERAIFRCRISIPGGGSAVGHGSETKADFADWVEKAETKARGRALHALGFDVIFAVPDTDLDQIQDEEASARRQSQQERPKNPERAIRRGDNPDPINKPVDQRSPTSTKINMEAVSKWTGGAAYWRNTIDAAREAPNPDEALSKVYDRMLEKPSQDAKMGEDYLDAVREELGFAPLVKR